jgi:hypothetical protein
MTISDSQPQSHQFAQDLKAALGEHFSTYDHRKAAESMDLSGLAALPAQELHITFGAPERLLMHATATSVLAKYLPLLGEEALTETFNRTVSDFLKEKQQDSWSITRKAGDVTVVFDEALTSKEHPANPELADFHHLGEIKTCLSLNGQSIALRGGGADMLSGGLPKLLEWLDTAQQVQELENRNFHECITVDAEKNASITPDGRLSIGAGFLRDADFDKQAQTFVLHHESGHTANKGIQEALNQGYDKLSFAFLPHFAAETLMRNSSHNLAEHMLKVHGNLEDAQNELFVLHGALEDLAPSLKSMADHVRHYPWIDSLNGMEVAADADNSTSFSAHMQTAPQTPDIQDCAETLETFMEALDGSGEDEEPDLQDVETLAADIEVITAKHPSLREDAQLLHDCAQYLSQAKEYLADLHAVKHMESPQNASLFFEREDGKPPHEGEASHPRHEQRSEACNHFASRILRERMQENSHSHNR